MAYLIEFFRPLIQMLLRKRWTRDRKTRGDGAAIADSFEVIRVIEVQNQVQPSRQMMVL